MEMLREILLFNLILCPLVLSKRRHHKKKDSSEEIGGDFITALRNDVNLDLPMDEEYEDLRAELLAYHTALSSIADTRSDGLPKEVADAVAAEPGNTHDVPDTRRSLKSTPCWQQGGICVQFKLCVGHRFLSEVNGCKSKLEVCCFTWNKFQMRDYKDKGINNYALPWSIKHEFGGKGVLFGNEGEFLPEEKNIPEGPQEVKIQSSIEKQDETEEYYYSSAERSKKEKKKVPTMLKNETKYHNSKKQSPALLVVLKHDKK